MSGLGDVPRGVDVAHVPRIRAPRQRSPRPTQIPLNELAQELSAVALTHDDTQRLPVHIGDADDPVRGVSVLRSADHALSVEPAYASRLRTPLCVHMHNGKVVHMQGPVNAGAGKPP